MIGILITGHGNFASGLGSALKLIAGENDAIKTVDFEASHSTQTLESNLEAAMDELSSYDGILVMSDIAGGSPFKAASELKFKRSGQDIEVISGTNLPMLVEGFLTVSMYDTAAGLADAMVRTGREQVLKLELKEREEEEAEDGI